MDDDTDMEIEFEPEDWETLRDYLQEWDDWRRDEGAMDMPAWTDESLYSVPVTIALMKSSNRLESLTRALFWLTVVLAILTGFNVAVTIYGLI